MFTSLRMQNFKAWKDTGEIRLAPLTLLFGTNSAGKSSVGHLLLALKQTVLSTDQKRALHLGDKNSLIDLGTFKDALFKHDLKQQMAFEIAWQLPRRLEVSDPVSGAKYASNNMKLAVAIDAPKGQPQVAKMRYELFQDGEPVLDIGLSRAPAGKYKLESDNYKFVRNPGRKWPLPDPLKYYGFPDESRAYYKNSSFLSDLSLNLEEQFKRLYFLGPLRGHPQRSYDWSGEIPADVGAQGEMAVAAILAAAERTISRGPRKPREKFELLIARWLVELGLIHKFRLKPIAAGRKEYEVLLQTHADASEVTISDVGFGISQVLPALVEAFYVPPNSTILMEQPEIHLHPQVQANLADVFISAVQAREEGKDRNIQLIVESHSEHFLNRLQRRIAEGVIQPDDVAVYFCNTGANGAVLTPLELNMFGDIENWPEDFFGDEMEEIRARTVAAMEKRKRQRAMLSEQG